MKRNFTFLILIIILASCMEKMPLVKCLSCGDDDTVVLTPQDKRVLIEEFSGVRCVQCPAGSYEIQNLQSIHGERLVAVSIHAGSLAAPYNQSQYDFRTEEGEKLLNFLGIPEGFPTGVINRKLFPGQPDLQLETAAAWAGYIASEMEEMAPVALEIDHSWNPLERRLTLRIFTQAFENIDQALNLSVFITESKIIDTQIVPGDGIIDDYEHNHVLRKSLTAFDGDRIADTLPAGELISKEFSFTLPTNWKAEDCRLIAFVHLADNDRSVLQAAEKHLIE